MVVSILAYSWQCVIDNIVERPRPKSKRAHKSIPPPLFTVEFRRRVYSCGIAVGRVGGDFRFPTILFFFQYWNCDVHTYFSSTSIDTCGVVY